MTVITRIILDTPGGKVLSETESDIPLPSPAYIQTVEPVENEIKGFESRRYHEGMIYTLYQFDARAMDHLALAWCRYRKLI